MKNAAIIAGKSLLCLVGATIFIAICLFGNAFIAHLLQAEAIMDAYIVWAKAHMIATAALFGITDIACAALLYCFWSMFRGN